MGRWFQDRCWTGVIDRAVAEVVVALQGVAKIYSKERVGTIGDCFICQLCGVGPCPLLITSKCNEPDRAVAAAACIPVCSRNPFPRILREAIVVRVPYPPAANRPGKCHRLGAAGGRGVHGSPQ